MTKEVDSGFIVTNTYTIKIYIHAHGGYFKYSVNSKEQACHHAAVIMKECTYRRVNDNNEFEFWPVYKVKVCGDGLDTEYPDEFVRT